MPPEGLVPIGRALRVKGKERGKGKLDRESRNSVAEFTCLSARGHYVLMRRVRRRMGSPNEHFSIMSQILYSDGSLFRSYLFRLRPQLELSPT